MWERRERRWKDKIPCIEASLAKVHSLLESIGLDSLLIMRIITPYMSLESLENEFSEFRWYQMLILAIMMLQTQCLVSPFLALLPFWRIMMHRQ